MEIRRAEDYYDQIQEKFPDLNRWEISRIVVFGLRMFYLHNLWGGDIIIKSRYFLMYVGRVFSSNLTFYHYAKIKWRIKLRMKYKRKKIRFDGKYYFGMTEKEYQDWESQFEQGKKKSKIVYKNVYAHKIKEECFLDHAKKYLFEWSWPEDMGFAFFRPEMVSRSVRLIGKRNKDNEIEFI